MRRREDAEDVGGDVKNWETKESKKDTRISELIY
jgi:hypothetical protein